MQDINDGSVFRQAYKAHIKDPQRDLLVPPIIFMDKTHCDTNGLLTIEPVSYTLAIFTKEARKNPAFWRCLGYVYNSSRSIPSQTPEQKQTDYHHAIKHIIASLVKAQKEDGILWQIKYQGKLYEVCMKIPLLLVAGDTEGHDKLCGKFTSRIKVNYLCRVCACPLEETSDPDKVHPLTKASKIAQLVEKATHTSSHHAGRYREELRRLSYYCLPNAWTDVVWCDPIRGINGSTPPELLHVIEQGLIPYSVEGILAVRRQLKSSAPARKRQRTLSQAATASTMDTATEDAGAVSADGADNAIATEDAGAVSADGVDNAIAQEEPDSMLSEFLAGQKEAACNQSVNSVFTDTEKSTLNKLAWIYGRRLVHQSCRDWQYAYFADGITNNSKKKAHEQPCVVLLLLLIFCSKEAEKYEQLMLPSILSNFIVVQSFLLLFENLHRVSSLPRKLVYRLKKFVPLFLNYYKTAINRTTGMGMNIVKFHLPLHWAQDMERFGPATSYDSSHGESMHKEFKADAKRTLRNGKSFKEQLGKCHHERLVLRRSLMSGQDQKDSPKGTCLPWANHCIYNNGILQSPHAKKKLHQWHNSQMMKSVEAYIQKNIASRLADTPIRLFKQCTVHGNLYRADPLYQPDLSTQFGWHDWVLVHWPEWGSDPIPSRIVSFLELNIPPGTVLHDPLVDESAYSEPGIYALVHALPESLNEDPQDSDADGDNYLSHKYSRLVYKSGICVNETSGHPELYLVHAESMFKGVCVAVPYDPFEADGHEFLILQPKHQWMEVLYQWSGELLAQNNK